MRGHKKIRAVDSLVDFLVRFVLHVKRIVGENAINNDLESKATKTEVKEAFKRMSNLYRAADVLQDKARAEGGTTLEQLMKKYPISTKIATGAAKVTGLGAGLHLLP